MILAVDIGNTNICVALFGKNTEPESILNYPDNLFHTSEAFERELRKICPKPKFAVLCSVVPALTNAVLKALKNICGENVIVVDSELESPVAIKGYDRKKLGSDRIVDMFAVKELYGTPAVVIDMGTATTVSVLDGDGAFIGGMIMPGLGLSINALSSGTALLPGIKPYHPETLLGQDTVSCINNGVIYSQASAIEGISLRAEEELQEKVKTVVTGGAAKFILPVCRREVIYDEHLLLKGLKLIYLNK